jgi:hypothetical protein
MEVRLVYSNIEFIKDETPPCTILAAPIRARLYEEDLTLLLKWGIDPANFIRELVHNQLGKIQKVG